MIDKIGIVLGKKQCSFKQSYQCVSFKSNISYMMNIVRESNTV